jgi:phosphate transport system protein
MSKHLQRELDLLRHQLLSLFGIVEQMIGKAFRALRDRRNDLAREVIDSDESVDRREVSIEEECLKLLALHQPVASDLRWLTMVIKINSDLERMADLACNIAERALALNNYPLFPIPDDLQAMVREASTMVRQALDAFVDTDVAMAEKVIEADDIVDMLNRKVIDELQDRMKESPENVEPALHCFSAARHLERVADLAENLAEDVIFLVKGEIVRHRHAAGKHATPSDDL